MSPRARIRWEHKPLDLQRVPSEQGLLYQQLCACGRKATLGGRAVTQKDQKAHRRAMVLVG